jgi:hypothetical protein
LGKEAYSAAVGGSTGNKYYLSMKDAANAWHMFVYDAQSGMWHREDAAQAVWFTNCQSDTFFVKGQELWSITKFTKALAFDETEETGMTWYAETGDILGLLPDKKYVSKIQISLSMLEGATFSGFIQYDSSSTWTKVLDLENQTPRKEFSIYFVPRRCQYYRLKFSGDGAVKVFAIARTITKGSDV